MSCESASAAYGPPDQDKALKAVRPGKAEPLETLISRFGASLGGRPIGARLFSRGNLLFYDLTISAPSGEVRHVIVEAETGARVPNWH